MWPGLLGAIALVPLYWLAVPARRRRDVLIACSLAGLALYDLRLPVLAVGVGIGLFALMRAVQSSGETTATVLTAAGLAALAALFAWNKLAGTTPGALPSQLGLVFIGVSYLVLKAAAALIESARGALPPVRFRDVLLWIAFLPTYPAGPMEELHHFAGQRPRFDRGRALTGLERILFGLVKAFLAAHYLGQWTDGVVVAPATHARGVLLLALYGLSLRFYFDFSGYSDIAIGLAALFGYDIEENFDRPLTRRNLAQLWQHWHMTLTRWLRLYLFIPVSRWVIRRAGDGGDRAGPAIGQIVAMTFCGLWHGIAWSFALWGFLHALVLVWVGVIARPLGDHLPPQLVRWWRSSPIAYALSTAITFTTFSLLMILVVSDVAGAVRYLRLLVGV